jgi:hypothetical protein
MQAGGHLTLILAYEFVLIVEYNTVPVQTN